jgi:transketolase
VLHQLPVRIVGVGCGFDYGLNGVSHYGLEDVAVLRCQPGLTIVAPADQDQARAAVEATWDLPGPIYYRIAKDDVLSVPGLDGAFSLGRAQVIARGRDVLLIALGNAAAEASAAARDLAVRGVSATVAVVASVAPPPAQDLVQLLRSHPIVFTIEAHYTTGGLGSLTAELIADAGLGCQLVRCGIPPQLGGVTGSTRFLMERDRLTAPHLAARVLEALTAAESSAKAGFTPDLGRSRAAENAVTTHTGRENGTAGSDPGRTHHQAV